MSDFPLIFAFYSFKGGVGRTMALVNVAYTLAARGRNVLLVDFDLEAPGLSAFLHSGDELETMPPRDGLDLLNWARRQIDDASGSFSASRADFVVSVRREKLDRDPLRPQLGPVGRVDLIPLDVDRDYTDRLGQAAVSSCNRDELIRIGRVLHHTFKDWRVPVNVPEYLGPSAERAVPYDYVLIDSRTGFSEIGALCVGPLSDCLVVLTSLNDQNIDMTRRFLSEIGVAKHDPSPESVERSVDPGLPMFAVFGPKKTILVASPLPIGEGEVRRSRLFKLSDRVGPPSMALSYHPRQALLETLFVRDWHEEYLAAEYNALADQMMVLANDHAMQLFRNVQDEWSQRKSLSRVLDWTIRLAPHRPDLGDVIIRRFAAQITPRHQPIALIGDEERLLTPPPSLSGDLRLDLTEEREFVLAVRALELLSRTTSPFRWVMRELRGWLLTEWSKRTKGFSLRDARSETGLSDWASILNANDGPPISKASALYHRGHYKSSQKNYSEAIADFTALLSIQQADPDVRYMALVNRGQSFFQMGSPERGMADYSTVISEPAAPSYLRALALLNRGNALSQQSRHAEVEADYRQVLKLEDIQTELKASAYAGLGWAAYRQKAFADAERLTRNAVDRDPHNPLSRANLGLILLLLGRTSDALEEYNVAIRNMKSIQALDEIEKDLQDALKEKPSLAGSVEVLRQIQSRRDEMKEK